MYCGVVNQELLSALKAPKALRRRLNGIEKLRQFFEQTPSNWPMQSNISCSFPLFLLYKYIVRIRQTVIAAEFRQLIENITKQQKTYFTSLSTPPEYRQNEHEYLDDY